MPRIDSGSVFGRLLGWQTGGYCSVIPEDEDTELTREYLDGTLILETVFRSSGGEARVLDCFAMRRGGALEPYNQLLRVIEGLRGRVPLGIEICPRFDYGEVRPWIRQHDVRLYSAIGGNDALLFWSDADIAPSSDFDLAASFEVRAGDRIRLSMTYLPPEMLDNNPPEPPEPEHIDRRLNETRRLWQRWSSKGRLPGRDEPACLRSAIVLKGLSNAPTGAIAAAATTSLPEIPGGESNWDYRFSWVRDSSFAVRSLVELGHDAEADGFRRFIERSAAGHAEDLQIVYGVGGERRLGETAVASLEGYQGAKPVRAGNAAHTQRQLDVYGHLLELAWRWHLRGHSPDDDYWRFLSDLVEAAAARWQEPDPGIWEDRGRPKHFVHSKVMCWVALDRGLRLARECSRQAPERRWARIRGEIRATVERRGYEAKRGIFVRAFGNRQVDAALLLLPSVGFVECDDERMVRTTDAIIENLCEDGLVWRYPAEKRRPREGAFLACSFWLCEVLARQGRIEEARETFDRAASTANDLGLFSEEFEPETGETLGNFPQALTHLSHITAALALAEGEKA
jgi:GH15 family glucan-1,4-alpha-glucosidase